MKYVTDMAFDHEGRLWAASRKGVAKWNLDDGSLTMYTVDDGLASKSVECLAVAADGTLWFGTSNAGVSHFDGENWTTYTTDDGLADDRVQHIAVGPSSQGSGALWFATFGGVSRFDGESWTTYTTDDGLAGDRVLSIGVESDGTLWFGTFGDGVSHFNGETWANYTTDDGLADDRVRCIIADSNGVLWFGTFGGGISRLEGQAFQAARQDTAWTTYTTDDGLAENVISCMAIAPDGTLWIGAADNGVSHFDPSAGSGRGGESCTNYTAAHGLVDNEIWSIVVAPDGTVWVSSINGISYLSPPD